MQTTTTTKKTTTTTWKPRATDFHFFDLICRGGNYCTFILSKIVNSPDIPLAELKNVGEKNGRKRARPLIHSHLSWLVSVILRGCRRLWPVELIIRFENKLPKPSSLFRIFRTVISLFSGSLISFSQFFYLSLLTYLTYPGFSDQSWHRSLTG